MKAVIFDLDMTLVDSSALSSWRNYKMWSHISQNLALVKPFQFKGMSVHELPGALQSAGLKIGIVTASPRSYARSILSLFRIAHDVLVSYEDTSNHKPDPEPLKFALQALGVAPNEAIYVGDDVIDVEASYHAGVVSVGAGWGVKDLESLSSAAPDLLLFNPQKLLQRGVLPHRRYLADSYARGVIPRAHRGAILACGGSPSRFVLGRYFKTSDPRHARDKLTGMLLDFKTSDGPADTFAPAIATAIQRFEEKMQWSADFVVPVPPKPSQTRNRFEVLMQKVGKELGAASKTAMIPDGLKCIKEVQGYKAMRAMERSEAMEDAFSTKYSWDGKRVLLLDDVLTTGATTDSCATVLLENGAKEVRILAIARDQQAFVSKICVCGRSMRVRTNSTTGEKFWGCSGYPDECRRTASFRE